MATMMDLRGSLIRTVKLACPCARIGDFSHCNQGHVRLIPPVFMCTKEGGVVTESGERKAEVLNYMRLSFMQELEVSDLRK